MATPRLTLLAPLLVAVVLVTGCQSVETRIKRHADTFASLSAEDQQRVRAAEVRKGDSPEFVELAYGKPNNTDEVLLGNGSKRLVWRYLESREIPDGVRVQFLRAPGANGAMTAVPKFKVIKVVGTEVTFLNNVVVNVRGGPPEAIRKQLEAQRES